MWKRINDTCYTQRIRVMASQDGDRTFCGRCSCANNRPKQRGRVTDWLYTDWFSKKLKRLSGSGRTYKR